MDITISDKYGITFKDIRKGCYIAKDLKFKDQLREESIYDELVAQEGDSVKWVTFEQLIIGYNTIKHWKENKLASSEYYIEKVRTENVKWNKTLYSLSIIPENLKCNRQYRFSPQNAIFVIKILQEYSTNPEFKKIRKGYFVKKNSEFLKMATDGFRNIMIDAQKDENTIRKQIELFSMVTISNDIYSLILRQSDLLKGTFCDLIDGLLVEDIYLNLMDRIIIYKYMWHELKRFLERWSRKWSKIINLMTDMRRFECAENNWTPDSSIFTKLYGEINYEIINNQEMNKIKTELYKMNTPEKFDNQKAEELVVELAVLEEKIISRVCKKYNIEAENLFYVKSWNMKSSSLLYKVAKKAVFDWNIQERRNRQAQKKNSNI